MALNTGAIPAMIDSPTPTELTVSQLGSQGDGVAGTAAGPVYIPFALPGERVSVELNRERGRMVGLLEPSPQRIAPVCRHFGECGGCAMQHLEAGAYAEWKRQRVIGALATERIETEVETPRGFGLHSRRRATFTAVKAGGGLALGFRRASSHDIIDVEECPVLRPRLVAALPGLRALLARMLPLGEARVLLTEADNGLDVLVEAGAEGKRRKTMTPFTPAHAAAAEALGVIRLITDGNIVFSVAHPQITFAGVPVNLPPGAFLQAVAEAESTMTALAVEAIGKARAAADLFCGLGAFTFALAKKAAVTAVESEPEMLAALEEGARRAQGVKPIRPLRRDLMREPLSPPELAAFGAVLFDPPRAGAIAQAKALARSKVPVVVAVSCNPGTFARDARALIDGGYALKRVVPVDQFAFSPHVELLAVFRRT